jgi:hypothetical protein
MAVTWTQLGFPCADEPGGFKAAVRDLYAEEDLGVFVDGFAIEVDNNDVAVLRVKPVAIKPADTPVLIGGSGGASTASPGCRQESTVRSSSRKVMMTDGQVSTGKDSTWLGAAVSLSSFVNAVWQWLCNTCISGQHCSAAMNGDDKIGHQAFHISSGRRSVGADCDVMPQAQQQEEVVASAQSHLLEKGRAVYDDGWRPWRPAEAAAHQAAARSRAASMLLSSQ